MKCSIAQLLSPGKFLRPASLAVACLVWAGIPALAQFRPSQHQDLPNYTTQILPTFDSLTVASQNQVVACNVYFAGASSAVWAMGLWPNQY